MIKSKKILALLTGRGGSSFKDKNIIKINNNVCLSYPCKEAKKIDFIDYFYCSSDDKKILNLSKKFGYESLVRPKYLSKSNSLHEDVIKHSLDKLKKKNVIPDIIVILLANAPIIKKKWIIDCINILIKNKKITAAVPVCKDNDKNPFRAKKISKGYLKNFLFSPKRLSSNRQDLPNSYFLCHNFWVIRTKSIIDKKGDNPWPFMGKIVSPYVVDFSIDIHNQHDVILAEYYLKKNDK